MHTIHGALIRGLAFRVCLLSWMLLFGRTPVHSLTSIDITSKASKQLQYRTAKTTDVPGISQLLVETFDDDIPSWNILRRKMAQDKYEQSLTKRFHQLIEKGAQHVLIVATCDPELSSSPNNPIVGFMELGMLPSPIPLPKKNSDIDTAEREDVEDTDSTIWSMSDEQPQSSVRDMPYLANLAVSQNYRRQKVGSKLVQLAIKVATKWCKEEEDEYASLFLSVEKSNDPAVALYQRLQFESILDETDMKKRRRKREARLYFQKVLNAPVAC